MVFWDCPGKPSSQGARQALCARWARPRGLAQVAWSSRFWRQATQPRLQGKRHLPGVWQASKWPAIAPPCSCSDPDPRPSAHGAPRAAAAAAASASASAAAFHLRPPPAFGARRARRRVPDPTIPSAIMHSLFRKRNKGKYSPTVQTRR